MSRGVWVRVPLTARKKVPGMDCMIHSRTFCVFREEEVYRMRGSLVSLLEEKISYRCSECLKYFDSFTNEFINGTFQLLACVFQMLTNFDVLWAVLFTFAAFNTIGSSS